MLSTGRDLMQTKAGIMKASINRKSDENAIPFKKGLVLREGA